MTYLILIMYIIIYSYIIRTEIKKVDFIIFFIPIGVLLIMILALQNNVGTDYTSYIGVADGSKGLGWIERKSEILFVYLVYLVRIMGKPQLIFTYSAIIQVLFLMLTTYEIKKIGYKLHNFFFLYFLLSLVFFNQFNLIRQYIAVYIIIYSLFKLRENKRMTFVILVIMASLFHSSAIFFIVFIFVEKHLRKKISFNKMSVVLLGLFILSFISLDSTYVKLLSYTKYSHYAYSSYFRKMPIKGVVTKLPKLIIVLLSSYLIKTKNNNKNPKDQFLSNMSYISMMIMILSFTSTVVWRIYQYLDFFIIFPVLELMEDKSNKTFNVLISLILIIMLVIKVIVMPQGEYLYNSILF